MLKIVLLLATVLSFSLSYDTCGWVGDLRYRRLLSLPMVASPARTDESFVLDTFGLRQAGKLRSDCSDLMIGVIDVAANGTSVLEKFDWWTETQCPGPSAAQRYTTFWVDVPENYASTDYGTYVFYGTNDANDYATPPTATGRLTWTHPVDTHGEIRLFASTCPSGWSPVSAWSGYFPRTLDSDTHGDLGTPISPAAQHHHGVPRTSFSCPNSGSTATESLVCDVDTSDACLRASHGHTSTFTGPTSSFDSENGDLSPYEPKSFVLEACAKTTLVGHRSDIVTGMVGLHLRAPSTTDYSGSWTHLSIAADPDSYLRFGTPARIEPERNAGHSHALSTYIASHWSTSASNQMMDACHYGNPDASNIHSSGHTHAVTAIGPLSSTLTTSVPIVPSHVSVHFWTLTSSRLIAASATWPDQANGTLALFAGPIPPLGFQLEDVSGVSGLLRSLEESTATVSLSSPVSAPGHQHSISSVTTSTDSLSSLSVSMQRPCWCHDWGMGMTSSHAHSNCAGVSSTPVLGDADELPPTVGLVLASRHDVPIRPISVGDEERFEVVNATDVNMCGYNAGTTWYIGVAAGLGSVVAIIILVVVVVVIIVGIIVIGRSRAKKTSAGGREGRGRGRSNELAETTTMTTFATPTPTMTPDRPEEVERVCVTVNENLFKIDIRDIELLQEVGRGGGGAVVYRARWAGQIVAYKQFSESKLDDAEFSEFEKEISLSSSLKHPNCATFYGCTLGSRLGIVMEFCGNGELGAYVQRQAEVNGQPLPLVKKLSLLLDVAHGMSYLHSKRIIHRDLKPGNIMLDDNCRCKLLDFGVSRMIANSSRMTIRIGTPIYMAPEIVLGRPYSFPIDVFSYAIMLYEIVTEIWHPYGIEAETTGGLEFRVANDPSVRPDLREVRLPQRLKSLTSRMWASDPDERPTFAVIVSELDGMIKDPSFVAGRLQQEAGAPRFRKSVPPPPPVPPGSRPPSGWRGV